MKITTTALAAIALAFATAACAGSEAADDASASVVTTAAPASTTTTQRPTETIDELVAIDSGRLHVRCSGVGETTVVLIAGWQRTSEDWARVEPTIAESTRVCAYDRFGTGTSDAPPNPQTFATQVADLHTLLDEIGELAPYLVVGHSMGGSEAVTFASTYPAEVAGLVLVDAAPNTYPEMVCSVPEYADDCALMRDASRGERLDAFPAFEAVAAITSLGDLPMTVLTAHLISPALAPEEATRLDTLWGEGAERWAELSTASRILPVANTGHLIQFDQPAIVIEEISKLLP